MALVGCPKGFVQHNGGCYKISTDKKKFNDARIACQNLPGNYDLAIVDNIDLFNALKGYTNHWIGLYAPAHQRTFRWINGQEVKFGKTWKKNPWSANEPNVSFILFFLSRFVIFYFIKNKFKAESKR